MLQRIIPSSSESIPVIGLGTWIKFDVTAESEKETLVNNIKLFAEHRGRLIDTSPMYGNAETVIGEVTGRSGIADKFFYATKVWISGKRSRHKTNGIFRAKNAAYNNGPYPGAQPC